MTEVNGVDTIMNLVGEPPTVIELNRKVVESQQRLMSGWNEYHIAILPFCFQCKEPLVWHTVPREDSTMFHCPKCGRIWTMEAKNDKKESTPKDARAAGW